MTNDLLIPLTDIGILLILLFIGSVITGGVLFAIEWLRRPFRRSAASDGGPGSQIVQNRRAPTSNAL
jgi:hypothetical protein